MASSSTISASQSAAAPEIPVAGELNGGPDRRMARELKLGEGRKDADIGCVGRKARGQHEYGFGKIELASDGLHFLRRQPAAIENDGKRVPCEGLGGEHVPNRISPFHGRPCC